MQGQAVYSPTDGLPGLHSVAVRSPVLLRIGAVSVLSLGVVVAGCSDGGGGGPIVPDPPQVTVVLPQPVVAGQRFPVQVTVTGCDPAATKVEIFDDQLLLKTFPFSGNPLSINLEANEIPYRSISARPLIKAKAFCPDGRFNTSAPQSGTFLPVEENIRLQSGGQVVPDTFVSNGQGSGATFIGCSENPSNGLRTLVRVDTAGNVSAEQATLPFECGAQASFTDLSRHRTRWMLEPYDSGNPAKPSGIIEIDEDLNIRTTFVGKVLSAAVAPDGSVVVALINPVDTGVLELRKFLHNAGNIGPNDSAWTHIVQPAGVLISNIVIDKTSQVVVASWQEQLGGNTGTVVVDRFDYRTGNLVASYPMRTVSFGFGDAPPVPTARLNKSGSVVYFPVWQTGNRSQVLACATRTPNCTTVAGLDGQPAGQVWISEVLDGTVLVSQPYADDSRVAAISSTATWFLSATNGSLRNATPLRPEGALRYLAFQEGHGRDFYLLAGDARPTELVAVDNAEDGELLRFNVVSGSVSLAIDEGGHPWFRVNTDLLRPHRLVEYRAAKIQ